MSTIFTTNLPNIAISKIGIGQLVQGSSPNVINISEGTTGQLLVSGGEGGADYWADGSSVLGADVILVGGNSPSSTLSFGAITDQAVSILQNNQQVIGISAAQAVTIGASGGTQTHESIGRFRFTGTDSATSFSSVGTGNNILIRNTNGGANTFAGLYFQDPSSTVYRGGIVGQYVSGAGAAVDLVFLNNSTENGRLSAAGAWTLGASGGTATHQVWGTSLRLDANVASTASFVVNNLNTGAAGAGVFIDTDGTGDAWTTYSVNNLGTQFSLGIDNSASDILKLTTGSSPSAGTTYLQVSTAGAITLGDSASTSTQTINAGNILATISGNSASPWLNLTSASNTAANALQLQNTATNGAVSQYMEVPAGTGDPVIHFRIAGTQSFSLGIDNSSSDAFKISASSGPGTNDYFQISTAGAVTLGASGGTQTHTVNGDFRLVKASTTSDGPRLRLESTDTNIAANEYIGTIDFYTNDGSGAGAGVCASIRGISTNTAALTDIVLSTGDTTTQTQALKATYDASVVVGAESANATTATAGFLYIPTCAGTPTGVPRAITGKVAMVFDTTNNELYVYDGGWISVALA